MARRQNPSKRIHSDWLVLSGGYSLYVCGVLAVLGRKPMIFVVGIGIAVFAIGILVLKLRSGMAPRRKETIQRDEAPLWFGLNGPFGV